MPEFLVAIIAIIVILLLAAAVSLVPFRISLNMEKDGPLVQGFYRIVWMGITLRRGRIFPETPVETKAPETEPMLEKPREEEEERMAEEILKKEKEKNRPSSIPSGQLFTQPALLTQPNYPGPDPQEIIEALPDVARVFLGLIKSIDIEKLYCRISFGLNDPSETAAISGYLWSIASVIGLYRADIHIEPYFGGEKLDGRFLAEIKGRILWIALAMSKALTETKIRALIIAIIRKEMAMKEISIEETGKIETHRREAA